MLAYMNELAFTRTLDTRKATYWSRSRNELWVQGETSGNTQEVEEGPRATATRTRFVLLKVRQRGGARLSPGLPQLFFSAAGATDARGHRGERVFDPEDVYKKK
jgi:hypothetical protein